MNVTPVFFSLRMKLQLAFPSGRASHIDTTYLLPERAFVMLSTRG